MTNQLRGSHSNRVSLLSRSLRVVAGMSLAAGLVGTGLLSSMAAVAQDTKPVTETEVTSTPESLPDGVYLYGQSDKPDVLGQGYFVFEVTKGDVVGALYMPRSSFDCAQGKFAAERLALSVTDSYESTTHPFEFALERTATVASNQAPGKSLVGLEGMHRLDTVSENDMRILKVCKDSFKSGS